jgi:hypothetical protein
MTRPSPLHIPDPAKGRAQLAERLAALNERIASQQVPVAPTVTRVSLEDWPAFAAKRNISRVHVEWRAGELFVERLA